VPGPLPTRAEGSAAHEAGVETLKDFGVELRELGLAEVRRDVEPDERFVPLAGALLVLGDLEPLLDRIGHGDVRAGLPALLDLVEHPQASGLGLGLGVDDLAQVAGPAGDRVGAGVDADAQPAGRQGLDAALGALAGWHAARIRAVHATFYATRVRPLGWPGKKLQVRGGAPGQIRTADTRFRRAVLYPLSYEGGDGPSSHAIGRLTCGDDPVRRELRGRDSGSRGLGSGPKVSRKSAGAAKTPRTWASCPCVGWV
jgi:hypothetical protein